MLEISPALTKLQKVSASRATEDEFIAQGIALVTALATELRVHFHEIRVCRGTITESARVIMHSDTLYIMLHERPGHGIDEGGLELVYRVCRGRGDRYGGMNHRDTLLHIAGSQEAAQKVLGRMRAMGGFGTA